MSLFILTVMGLYLVRETVQQSCSRPFNFRNHCNVQHSKSKYSAACYGSSNHFKDKNLFLDGQCISDMDEITLSDFDSIYFTSHKSPGIRKISIKNTKNVTLVHSIKTLQSELEIDSVEELTLGIEQTPHDLFASRISLSSIAKLRLNNTNKIKAEVLNFNKVGDVIFHGANIQLSGKIFTLSKSKCEIDRHSVLTLNYTLIEANYSELYVNENAHLNVSTENLRVQDSNLFIHGKINVSNQGYLERGKVVKFSKNSFYGLHNGCVEIYGKHNKVEFIENFFSVSVISNVLDLMKEDAIFVDNSFDCNKCANKLNFSAEDLQYIGDKNLCYSNCNLTLSRYQELLDKHYFCNDGEKEVNHKTLCSEFRDEPNGFGLVWWLLCLVILIIIGLIVLFCIYRKSGLRTFQPVSVEEVIPHELKLNPITKQVTAVAFNNRIYETVGNNSNCENVYEQVDPSSR